MELLQCIYHNAYVIQASSTDIGMSWRKFSSSGLYHAGKGLLRRRAVKVSVQLQGFLAPSLRTVLCWGKANKFERPFASHRANGMLFKQLRSALPLRLSKNWLWVPLIVTLPITGTMPWYPPRVSQSRGSSLLLTSVHVEQN